MRRLLVSRGVRELGASQAEAITGEQWKVLFAAQAGYMLDAMDVLLYVFALNALKAEFHMSNALAGAIGSVTLVFSAVGGISAGVLADRFGRTRLLAATILWYSLASAGAATATSVGQLMVWRALVGVGLGGEWSAGAVLVAETWPDRYRARAIGFMQSGWALGYLLAAGVTAAVLPRYGWRALFLTGLAPALLALAVRRSVAEPEAWRQAKAQARPRWTAIFGRPFLRVTASATALTTCVLFGYWGLFTWLPSYLQTPRSKGGAGLSLLATSASIVPVQVGAFLGYVTFGFVSERFGRRPAFLTYMLAAAALVPFYGLSRDARTLLLLGPLVGFFGSGYFSLFGEMLAQLYPVQLRGAGQGFTYNGGRALSALAPLLVGMLADHYGIGLALLVNSAFFLMAAAAIFLLPERGLVSQPRQIQ